MQEPTIEILSETDNFSVWRSEEPDGETTYHLELGFVTVHFFREEWEEFLKLIANAGEG
ncbi:MAG: hypothetical protein N2508_14575 [Anaerolineae bacterium]|nr:hypothetical protein [Anaerolineae bacterium]